MNRFRAGLLAAVFLAAGCWMMLFAQEDRRHGTPKLPAAVTNSWHRLYPGTELRDANEEGNGTERIYKLELDLPEKQGDAILKIMADGSLIELKEDREIQEIPDTVRTAIARAFPKGRVTETRIITRTVVTYEVEIRQDNRRQDVTVSPRGKILEIDKR